MERETGSEPGAYRFNQGAIVAQARVAEWGRHSAPASSSLELDRDQVRQLHGPDALDQLGDGNAVRLADAEHDQSLRSVVGQLRAVVEVELLEGFQEVVETAQALAAPEIVRLVARERGPVRYGQVCVHLCHFGVPAWAA